MKYHHCTKQQIQLKHYDADVCNANTVLCTRISQLLNIYFMLLEIELKYHEKDMRDTNNDNVSHETLSPLETSDVSFTLGNYAY